MKSNWTKFLPILFGVLLFFGCVDPTKSLVTNPFFNSDPALKEITLSISKSPKDPGLYYSRGKMLVKLKQDTLALNDFKMASSLDTNNAVYYSAVGDLLFENKDLDGSVEWLQKAITKNPADPKARLKIAKLFLYIKDYTKAIEQVNIVLRKDIYNPEAYFLKGMVYQDSKDTAKAISAFVTTLEVAPDYKEAIIQLGLLYSAKNDPLAVKYLETAYKMDSSDVFPMYARGVYLQNHNLYDSAKTIFRKCIIKNTHFVDAYFNMGYILMQQDSIAKSFSFYDIAVKLQPDNPTAYYDRGVCNEMMNKMPDAINDYRIAVKLDTGYKSPKAALARLKVKM